MRYSDVLSLFLPLHKQSDHSRLTEHLEAPQENTLKL